MSGATRNEHRLYTAVFYDLAGQFVTAAPPASRQR